MSRHSTPHKGLVPDSASERIQSDGSKPTVRRLPRVIRSPLFSSTSYLFWGNVLCTFATTTKLRR
eukprot:4611046-Pyramimonas_sp.AAC.1